MGIQAVPILVLDLDGTVRHGTADGGFCNKPEDIRIFPGVPALIADYRAAGFRVIGVSNQGGVALGHLTREDAQAVQQETQRLCGPESFDGMNFCVHHPASRARFTHRCDCRKPRAGMAWNLLVLLGRQNPEERYPPEMMIVVGDRAEDRGLAWSLNASFLPAASWRLMGVGEAVREAKVVPDPVWPD